MYRVRLLRQAVMCLALATIAIRPAGAETKVDGDAAAVRLQARDASVEEILAALHERFGMNYRGLPAATRRINATFEGPLNRVVAHVLDGYDFVIKRDAATLDVVVLGGGSPRQAGPSPVARSR
jgi:hypothetical protein